MIDPLAPPVGLRLALVRAGAAHAVPLASVAVALTRLAANALGFTALGVGAGEMIAAVQVAMRAGLPYPLIGDMVLTHPTIAEGLGELFATPFSASEADNH